MCKRILNIRDNDTYTAADIGKRLNEYFVKHNLKVTNKHYEKHLFLDLCKAEGLEPGKHKGFEFLPIAQKEIDRVKANQGKKTAQPKKIPQPKKAPAITPLEEMAEKTAKEMAKAETVNAIIEKPTEVKLENDLISRSALKADFERRASKARNWKEHAILDRDKEIEIRATATLDFICEVIMTIDKAPACIAVNADEFEAKRKKFYTDFHYFVKACSTPEERIALLNALAALYGYSNKKEG